MDINFDKFIYSYIINVKNKEELIIMIKSIPYIYHDLHKKKELINFSEDFKLNSYNLKSWLIAFAIVLKYSLQ